MIALLPKAEDDALPVNAISLSTAFARWCRLSVPDWDAIQQAFSQAHLPLDVDALPEGELKAERQIRRAAQDKASIELVKAERSAATTMRVALASGEITAYFREPKTGDALALIIWSDDRLINFWLTKSISEAPALESDFVAPDDADSPGPWAQSGGQRRRVFLWKEDFEKWLLRANATDIRSQESNSSPKKRRGRTLFYDWSGGKDYVHQLLDERGDFSENGQESDWKCQADVERALSEYVRDGDVIPTESLVRQNVVPMINEWRAKQAVKS